MLPGTMEPRDLTCTDWPQLLMLNFDSVLELSPLPRHGSPSSGRMVRETSDSRASR
jgi:hypothetical protein